MSSFWNDIPLDSGSQAYFEQVTFPRIMKELKEHNKAKVGAGWLVRIPQIEGRISHRKKDHTTYIEYIYKRWYDKESQQTRNRKVIIGQAINVYPGAMIPFDAYYQYFDENTGELLPKKENKKEAGPEADNAPKQQTAASVYANPAPAAVRQADQADSSSTETKKEPTVKPIKAADQKASPEAEDREYLSRKSAPQDISREHGQGSVFQADSQATAIEDTYSMDEEAYNLAKARAEMRKERFRMLQSILDGIRYSVEAQARKRPDAIINAYKAGKINQILDEIREYMRNTEYISLLERIQEPEETEDGQKTGMSYSDAEILLNSYHIVMITVYYQEEFFWE